MAPNSWSLVMLPLLIWSLASPRVLRASLTILYLVILLFVTWGRQLLWVSSKLWTRRLLELAVTKSAQKAQKAKWILPLTPATPVLISGGRTVSELFVSIGHLSLIVKDWLMITMHFKTFRRKECFVDHLCVGGVGGSFKLLVFKISTF